MLVLKSFKIIILKVIKWNSQLLEVEFDSTFNQSEHIICDQNFRWYAQSGPYKHASTLKGLQLQFARMGKLCVLRMNSTSWAYRAVLFLAELIFILCWGTSWAGCSLGERSQALNMITYSGPCTHQARWVSMPGIPGVIKSPWGQAGPIVNQGQDQVQWCWPGSDMWHHDTSTDWPPSL